MSAIVLRPAYAAASAAALAALTIATPARAVSCDDVRALSKAEQIYWVKKLNLSADQQHQIRQACYGQARLTEAKNTERPAERVER